MKPKPIIPRELPNRDIDAVVGHNLTEGGDQAAGGFVDALERAFAHIGRHPAAGSHRYAEALDLPGLRSWSLNRYPYLVFYVERDDHIDIWRVLHGQRDIPASMRTPEDP